MVPYDGRVSVALMLKLIEHYGCMVDILGRAGYLEEAEDFITNIPFEPNGIILSSLLSSCGQSKDTERAKIILRNEVELEPRNDGKWELCSVEELDDVKMVKNMMWKNEAKKEDVDVAGLR
ncbi:hypothetical protein YC2023_064085 [Brassica napus]